MKIFQKIRGIISTKAQMLSASLTELFWGTDITSVRFSIALSSLMWSVLLFWPGVLFTPTRVTYRLMSEIANETVWAIGFLIHSVFAFTTLLCGIKNRITFIGDALWGSILWTAATITCFASHWQIGKEYAPPAAMSAEVALMIACWWWVVRWIVDRNQKVKF